MSEPNPYEPPKTDQQLKRSQKLKRSVGVGVILLLTPPALVVTFLTCCTVSRVLFNEPGSVLGLIGPLLVLVGLMTWAARLDRGTRDERLTASRRRRILLAMPFIVAGSLFIGMLLAGVYLGVSEAISNRGNPDDANRMDYSIATVLFVSAPTITLIAMLWRAWRAE
jgi:hypothetical protein